MRLYSGNAMQLLQPVIKTVFYYASHYTYRVCLSSHIKCFLAFSHTSYPHNLLTKQLAAFPHRLIGGRRMTHVTETFVKYRKECSTTRAWVRTHNPWIDSPCRYRLSYRVSVVAATETVHQDWSTYSFSNNILNFVFKVLFQYEIYFYSYYFEADDNAKFTV